MKTWREYWNADSPIYVSERHKLLHYRAIASDLADLVREIDPSAQARILDYGSGEALEARRLGAVCKHLTLSDAAPLVRERLTARFAAEPAIAIASPEDVAAMPDDSFDIIVANSLVQYLSRAELGALLETFRDKLKPTGTLVLADIIPRSASAPADVAALLGFSLRGGFMLDALKGIARTALSDYRRLRSTLGLARYDEGEMLGILTAHGFAPQRRRPNIGHNQRRMTFLAVKRDQPSTRPSVSAT